MLGLGLPVRLPRNSWLLNCCVPSPQSEIAHVRIDRTLIGAPSNFRHVAHLGAGDDLSSADDGMALGAMLRSKGGPEFAMQVPQALRAKDMPIGEDKRQRTDENKTEEKAK